MYACAYIEDFFTRFFLTYVKIMKNEEKNRKGKWTMRDKQKKV
jgi:hypothetical protein